MPRNLRGAVALRDRLGLDDRGAELDPAGDGRVLLLLALLLGGRAAARAVFLLLVLLLLLRLLRLLLLADRGAVKRETAARDGKRDRSAEFRIHSSISCAI